MPFVAKPKSRRWIRLSAWLAAWVFLAGLGSLLHWATWLAPISTPPIDTFLCRGFFKNLSAAMSIPVTPAWAIMWTALGKVLGSLTGVIVVNAIGWAVWLAALAIALRVRRIILRRPAKPQPLQPPAPPPPPEVPSPVFSRRRLLLDGAIGAVAVTSAGSLAHGTMIEPWSLGITRYRVPIADLPAGLDGLRIVQVCDTHLGPRVDADFIRGAVAMALGLNADVYALVGDYVHNQGTQVQPAADLFAPLVATGKPVLATLGNHDWYAGGRQMQQALRNIGAVVIDNRRVVLSARTRNLVQAGQPGDCLCFAGLGDLDEDTIDPHAALAGIAPVIPRVVLAHQPDTAEDPRLIGRANSPGYRVDLMLSGHTHGGQVRLPLLGTPIIPSRFGSKYARGLVRGPAFPVIISAGVGLSMIPVRFGVPPEIVEITLVRPGQPAR